MEPWIETFTGKQFYFLDPTRDSIDIRDIAHSLAFTCRYTGHCKRFYSVAEHSILVSYLADDPLAGLLHDASEAYITDIASPIKPHLTNYKELEDMLMGRIADRFNFTYPLNVDIKDCDATQLKTEAKHLLRSGGYPWAHLYPTRRPHGITPSCWGPEEAEKKFLERYDEVKNESFYVDDTTNQTIYRPGDFTTVVSLSSTLGMEANSRSLSDPRVKEQSSHCGKDSQGEGTRYENPDCRPCETEGPK